MIVYESTKQVFVEDVVQDRIEENIDRKFYEKMGMRKLREGDFPIGNGYYMNDYIMGLDI